MKGDRSLKLKLAVLLTPQWYYLITPLAAKQYQTTEEPGLQLHAAQLPNDVPLSWISHTLKSPNKLAEENENMKQDAVILFNKSSIYLGVDLKMSLGIKTSEMVYGSQLSR